jgi:hypothetical protein
MALKGHGFQPCRNAPVNPGALAPQVKLFAGYGIYETASSSLYLALICENLPAK